MYTIIADGENFIHRQFWVLSDYMKKLLMLSSALAVFTGVVLAAGGVWGVYFTYKNVASEKIVTPKDSSIPEKPVRGPLTLKAQADIIRKHTLKITGGQTFAEMPRQIPKVDENGNPLLDAEDKPVMTENSSRDIWITATTLRTALHLGILSYVLSGMSLVLGCMLIWTGVVFYALNRELNPG